MIATKRPISGRTARTGPCLSAPTSCAGRLEPELEEDFEVVPAETCPGGGGHCLAGPGVGYFSRRPGAVELLATTRWGAGVEGVSAIARQVAVLRRHADDEHVQPPASEHGHHGVDARTAVFPYGREVGHCLGPGTQETLAGCCHRGCHGGEVLPPSGHDGALQRR